MATKRLKANETIEGNQLISADLQRKAEEAALAEEIAEQNRILYGELIETAVENGELKIQLPELTPVAVDNQGTQFKPVKDRNGMIIGWQPIVNDDLVQFPL